MRRADGRSQRWLAVRQRRAARLPGGVGHRSHLNPPLVVAPVGATAGGPVDDGDGGGSRFYLSASCLLSGERVRRERERGWGDGRRPASLVSDLDGQYSFIELGSVGSGRTLLGSPLPAHLKPSLLLGEGSRPPQQQSALDPVLGCPQDPKENSFPAQKGSHEANLMLASSNRSEASSVGGPST